MPIILWLSEITTQDASWVGSKARNLAELSQAGFPVPAAFCITRAAYEQYITLNHLSQRIETLQRASVNELPAAARQIQIEFLNGTISQETHRAILSAYHTLTCGKVSESPAVAVRSSASTEDLPNASFAGQQDTLLNVQGEEQLLQAVRTCWSSLWSSRAVLYRRHQNSADALVSVSQPPPVIAVLIQCMVDADAAGVAFSQDPITGAKCVIVEAARGWGETVVGDGAGVERYVVSQDTSAEAASPHIVSRLRRCVPSPRGTTADTVATEKVLGTRVLPPDQVQQITKATLAIEHHFHSPQDVEWALAQGQLFVLQARPITTLASSFFTDSAPTETSTWTAGFLNERFPQPVSPLGWTLVKELLEKLAFRDPLHYLGVRHVDQIPITRLYRGHPYVNMFVFQTLYKVFPNALLPEDASRYFPDGKTELRREVRYPRCLLQPRVVISMARHLLQQPTIWSPWQNYHTWKRFAAQHERISQQIEAQYGSLCKDGGGTAQIWSTVQEAQTLNERLLALHRWSLTWADLTYTLLRHLLQRYTSPTDALNLSTALVTALPNKSVELNDALCALADQQETAAYPMMLSAFLQRYGHRSYSLDIYHPSFAEEPAQVLDLLTRINAQSATTHTYEAALAARQQALHKALQVLDRGFGGGLRSALFQSLLHLTQNYMALREEQRFYWQRTLALQRHLFLLLGQRLVDLRVLNSQRHIFFLTKSEIEAYIRGRHNGLGYAECAVLREQQYARLRQEFNSAAAWSYPPFLRGDHPLEIAQCTDELLFRGRAISPGLARGRVVVVCSPDEFDKVQRGDILVTSGVDPGWTPLFATISALVMEHGGQLSHGAVVAREYGLPTVAGLPGITQALRDGDIVMVDGLNGLVRRVSNE